MSEQNPGMIDVHSQRLPDTALRPGHPRGFAVVCLTGMWKVFALAGTRAVLVFYLVKELRYSQGEALQIYAVSSAAAVVLGLAGGLAADRVFGLRRAVVIGAILMALGDFTMMVRSLLFVSLLLLAVGEGLLWPPLIAQVGLLYASGDSRRERAFTYFKVGCNFGALLAPVICGLAAERWGWEWAFMLAGFGMLAALGTYLAGRGSLPSDPARAPSEPTGPRTDSGSGGAYVTLGIAWIGAAFFWTAYNQIGGAVALWADGDLDRVVRIGERVFTIPAAWFQAVNPLLILLLGPIVGWSWSRGGKRTDPTLNITTMAQGTLLLAASFGVLALSAGLAHGAQPNWVWLTAAIVPFTLGELYVEPTGQALFTRLAPERHQSVVVSIWMLTVMMGFFGSGWLAAFWGRVRPEVYFQIVTSVALIGVGVLLSGWLGNRKRAAA